LPFARLALRPSAGLLSFHPPKRRKPIAKPEEKYELLSFPLQKRSEA
jgi:hypothetical protein